jgi:hypothetical protein
MVDIKTIALLLLIARAVSVYFIVLVLYRQYKLFGTEIDFKLVPNLTTMERKHVYQIRRILFALSCIILLGNLVPIVIDVLTLFINTERPANLRPISIMYAFSNSFTAAFSAIMIWTLYRVAGLGGGGKK